MGIITSLIGIGFNAIGGWFGIAKLAGAFLIGVFVTYKYFDYVITKRDLREATEKIQLIADINAENEAVRLAQKEDYESMILALSDALNNQERLNDDLLETLEELNDAPQEDDRVLSDTSQRFYDRLRIK